MSSIDSFNQRSHPNEMLTGLRYFERANKGDNGNLTKVSVTALDSCHDLCVQERKVQLSQAYDQHNCID